MKSIAIHKQNDWYLINLPVFGDIPNEQIEVGNNPPIKCRKFVIQINEDDIIPKQHAQNEGVI